MPEKHPESLKVLKIGAVGTGPFSFYGSFNRAINNSLPYNPYSMRVTHVWGDDYRKNYKGSPEYVKKMLDFWGNDKQSPEGMAKELNIPNVCKDFREMADEVDAALIMDYDRAYELAEPFLERGKPIYICSPVAVTVGECEKLLDLAEANNAAVYTGAYSQDLYEHKLRTQKVKQDDIATFYASTSFDFYTSYAPDGLDPIYRLVGPGTKKVSLHGWDGSKGYDPTGIPVSRIHLEYEPRGDKPPIQGCVTLGGYKRATEEYKVLYHNHSILEGVNTTNWSIREQTLREMLIEIQHTFFTNKSPETREDIVNKLKVLIAAFKSANEGGRVIDVDEVGDFRLPTVRIEKWDEIPEN